MSTKQRIQAADSYLERLSGNYPRRRQRYSDALAWLEMMGMSNSDVIFDVGSGDTQFDFCLRREGHFMGRYVPVDACIDGVDLDTWKPPRLADFYVCLEVFEHLEYPRRLFNELKANCNKGIIISTPNPAVVDVLKIDETHRTPIHAEDLQEWGCWMVHPRSYYGKDNDTLVGVYQNFPVRT